MADEEGGVLVALIVFMFRIILVWDWLLRMVGYLFGAPTTTTTTRGLPEHRNLRTRDLTEVENVIADNTEPGAGRRRTDIAKILPIVADGEYDHAVTGQFQARQAPMHENIAVDAAEAEADLALLLVLGSAVGLQRQIDAEATPVQEPETDVTEASPVQEPETDVTEASPVQEPETDVAEASPVQEPETDVAEASPVQEPGTDVPEASPVQEPGTDVPEISPVQEPGTDVAEATPVQEPGTDVAEASPVQEPRTDVAEASPVQEPETDVADADELRMIALASGAGPSRVATVSLGVPVGGLESNLEAEPMPRTQKADKIQGDEN